MYKKFSLVSLFLLFPLVAFANTKKLMILISNPVQMTSSYMMMEWLIKGLRILLVLNIIFKEI